MKHLLTLCAVSLAVVAGAQTDDSRLAGVVKYVEDTNKNCPMQVGAGLTQTAVALSGHDLVFDWTVESDDAFATLKSKHELVRQTKVAELSMSDPSENQLVNFVSHANIALVYNLINKSATDTVTIRISKQDL